MVLATNNPGKLKEIKEILKDYEIYSLKEKGLAIDVLEDADTFYGNALKKAQTIYNLVKEPVIADDSGLCITALDDFPGVLTHRFLGEDATNDARNSALIEMLSDPMLNREAEVVCDLVYYDGNNTLVGEGILKGKIASFPRGENGFGFDAIFELENGKTLAELTSEEKNALSARYLACVDLLQQLKTTLKHPVKNRL